MTGLKSFIKTEGILILCLFFCVLFRQDGLAGDKTELLLSLSLQTAVQSPVDFPPDHFHHRGLSWMWPKVWINGNGMISAIYTGSAMNRKDCIRFLISGQSGKLDLSAGFWSRKITGRLMTVSL